MCNIVHTCIKKYTVAVLYSCKFCTARVFLFLADHEAIQFTNILKIRRYLCADEAKGLLVPYVLVAVRRVTSFLQSPRSFFTCSYRGIDRLLLVRKKRYPKLL